MYKQSSLGHSSLHVFVVKQTNCQTLNGVACATRRWRSSQLFELICGICFRRIFSSSSFFLRLTVCATVKILIAWANNSYHLSSSFVFVFVFFFRSCKVEWKRRLSSKCLHLGLLKNEKFFLFQLETNLYRNIVDCIAMLTRDEGETNRVTVTKLHHIKTSRTNETSVVLVLFFFFSRVVYCH